MEVLRLHGYTELEKVEIAKQYLVKKQRETNGLTEKNLTFTDDALTTIIRGYTREAGVRNLEREIGNVCRKVARKVVKEGPAYSVAVTEQNVPDYLGVIKFRDMMAHEKNEVGLVTGLAWTEVGGTILTTEVLVVEGKGGKPTLTGKLGDVMQESAQAALTYVRSRAAQLGLPRDFYRNVDIHVHVPEGAIPKDGPSAGITMATALASAKDPCAPRLGDDRRNHTARQSVADRRVEREAPRRTSRRMLRSLPAQGQRERPRRGAGKSSQRDEAALRRRHGPGSGDRS
jgi:ATP-dependent Lon protease